MPPSTSRAAGTVGARPVRLVAAVMPPATVGPSVSTRTGRSTIMCAARVCRALRLQWLTHCLDSLMPLPAPAKPAQQGPLAPALQAHRAHWTLLCPADLRIQCPAYGHHALPTSWSHRGPPDTWSRCVESLLLLLLSKRKHRSNETASVQPQLPDKVCQDLSASLCKHPQKPLQSCRQRHQQA